jgi:hypothetical protein
VEAAALVIGVGEVAARFAVVTDPGGLLLAEADRLVIVGEARA